MLNYILRKYEIFELQTIFTIFPDKESFPVFFKIIVFFFIKYGNIWLSKLKVFIKILGHISLNIELIKKKYHNMEVMFP